MFVLEFSHQGLPGPHSSILSLVENEVLASTGCQHLSNEEGEGVSSEMIFYYQTPLLTQCRSLLMTP